MKPGWQTTEFWITTLQLLLGVFMANQGHNEVAMILLGGAGLGGAAYANGRSQLKKG